MSAQTWPDQVIDPHIHQWDPYTTPRHSAGLAKLFRPLPRIPRWLAVLAPRADREFVGDPHHALKPYLPLDYRADAGELPVTKVMHVEAAWLTEDPMGTVAETRWVAALPFGQDDAPELAGIVAKADPRWPNLAAVLDAHLEASPLVRGVRHSLATHDDPAVRDWQDERRPISDALVSGFAPIAERGLTFELWVYAHQLPDLHRLITAYPETTFVLDHYATPVGIFGPRGRRTGRTEQERATLLARWRDDLAAVAEHPNVVAKASGLGMPILGHPRTGPFDPWPLIRHLHASFGPDRVMWASNFPMDKPVHSIPDSARTLLAALGEDADPQRLFHDVAARVYRL
jgi:predicted TIM-barrel fold metal-dependent hydrolase